MEHDSASLAEIAALSGAKPRSIQLWADAGLLEALPETDRAGTGTHRRFRRDEIELAAVLAVLAEMGITIGKLRHCAKSFRALRKRAPRGYPPSQQLVAAMERARKGEGRNRLLYLPWRGYKEALRAIPDNPKASVMESVDKAAIVIDLNALLCGASE